MTNQLQPPSRLLLKTCLLALVAPMRWPVDAWQTRQERQAFSTGVESAWAYCARVWDRPYVDAWCQLLHSPSRPRLPRAAELLLKFSEQLGRNQQFILEQAQSTNPVLVAYAVRLLQNPNELPAPARQRSEVIRLRDWYYEIEMPLSDWIERVIDWHNRAEEF